MKIIFKVVVVLSILLFGCPDPKTNNEEETIAYLKLNNSVIDTNHIYKAQEFEILSHDVSNYDVFLFGETHAVAFNELIDIKFLKYLYHNAGVRYYIVEMGYGGSTYLNKYIQTGNTELLDYFYRMNYGVMSTNKDSYNAWKKIRNFNTTLPDSEKITVFGIDVEHQIELALEYLNQILPNSVPPSIINDKIKALKNYNSVSYEQKHLIGVDLYDDIQANETQYKIYLKDAFFDFQFVVTNIKKTWHYKFPESDPKIREKAMYDNFIELSNHFPKAGYYGKFGKEHVIQHYAQTKYMEIDQERFALCLNADSSAFKNKTLSIVGIYLNCDYLANTDIGYQPTNVSESFKDISLLDFDGSLIQLFKLDKNNSPFKENLYFLHEGLLQETTSYFQYIIKIKNSEACEEYQKNQL